MLQAIPVKTASLQVIKIFWNFFVDLLDDIEYHLDTSQEYSDVMVIL